MAAESANERVDFSCLTAQPPGCRYPSHFFLLGLSFKASGEGEVFVTEGACISAQPATRFPPRENGSGQPRGNLTPERGVSLQEGFTAGSL